MNQDAGLTEPEAKREMVRQLHKDHGHTINRFNRRRYRRHQRIPCFRLNQYCMTGSTDMGRFRDWLNRYDELAAWAKRAQNTPLTNRAKTVAGLLLIAGGLSALLDWRLALLAPDMYPIIGIGLIIYGIVGMLWDRAIEDGVLIVPLIYGIWFRITGAFNNVSLIPLLFLFVAVIVVSVDRFSNTPKDDREPYT